MSTYYEKSPINGRMIEHHLPNNVKNLKYTQEELDQAIKQERQRVIDKIEQLKAVAAMDVIDQEYEDGYVYERNGIIDEIIKVLKEL